MRNKFILLLVINLFFLSAVAISAQDDSTKQKIELAVGVAKTVGEQKIVMQTKAGVVDAVLTKSSKYFRLPPDNLKLSAATESKLEDISVTDRVLVTGTFSKDRKTLYAVKVYLVKGSDIEEQQEKQRREWRQRGISGRVTLVDSAAKTISVEMRAITGAVSTLKLSPKEDVKYLRYSNESVKYSDAVKSDFSSISKGDTIQALGDRGVDGKSFTAEEILTGAFVTVAGKVKSIDAENNEVTITDLKTKKDVTIRVKDTSLMKKFPEEQAQRMVRFMAMMRAGGGTRPPARQGNRGQGQGNRGGGRGGRRGGMGRMDINQMLNRFPTIKVSDLSKGEMIAVSSPKGKDATRLTAIKLLAGVEPFITLASSGGRGGGRGRGGVRGGLSIPGLDSVQF